jgi:hypothetical protein
MNLSIFALLSSGLGVRVTRDGACNQRLEGPDLPNEVVGSTNAGGELQGSCVEAVPDA